MNYKFQTRLMITTFLAIICLGCEKQKDLIEKFVFDNTQMTRQTVYRYTYNPDSTIKMERRTSFNWMAGEILDSTVYETAFTYNARGKVISAVDNDHRQVRVYNELDSLIGDYRINQSGDTTRLFVIVYDGNLEVGTVSRILLVRVWEDLNDIKKEMLHKYDTTYSAHDYIYENGVRVKSVEKDKNGVVTGETEYYYESSDVTKYLNYAFLGDTKYLKSTTYFSKGSEDYTVVGTSGDTIQYMKTFVKKDGKVVVNYHQEFGIQDFLYYNNQGQIIADVFVELDAKEKTVSKLTYDRRGNIIEEVSYTQKL